MTTEIRSKIQNKIRIQTLIFPPEKKFKNPYRGV